MPIGRLFPDVIEKTETESYVVTYCNTFNAVGNSAILKTSPNQRSVNSSAIISLDTSNDVSGNALPRHWNDICALVVLVCAEDDFPGFGN
jgi:hypothetical protein